MKQPSLLTHWPAFPIKNIGVHAITCRGRWEFFPTTTFPTDEFTWDKFPTRDLQTKFTTYHFFHGLFFLTNFYLSVHFQALLRLVGSFLTRGFCPWCPLFGVLEILHSCVLVGKMYIWCSCWKNYCWKCRSW